MNVRTVIVAVVLSTAPAACAPIGAASGTSTGSGAVARVDRRHEYPSPPVTQQAVAGAATPTLAVAAFAVAYINWTAQTVSGRMRGLAALSVGQARSLVALTAAQTARDYELRRGGVANTGIVEAIARVIGQPVTYAVVTRERTTATGTDAYRGLAPSWHVALATVIGSAHGGWVVSGWQPES
ncbi:MAG: hypothetical protein M3022_10440 [Actinomycetota bacterium]|nr:hypothetical protein [Actinomycetota bacterium]